MTDSQGNLLEAIVHNCNLQDRVGGKLLIEKMIGKFPRLKRILADGAYLAKIQQVAH